MRAMLKYGIGEQQLYVDGEPSLDEDRRIRRELGDKFTWSHFDWDAADPITPNVIRFIFAREPLPKLAGFWGWGDRPPQPTPADRSEAHIELLRWAQERLEERRAERGVSLCRICGAANGNATLRKGGWIWPEGYLHYLLEHGVSMDPDMYAELHALRANLAGDAEDS